MVGVVLGSTRTGFLIEGDDGQRYGAAGECPAGVRVSFERLGESGPRKRRARYVTIIGDPIQDQLQRLSFLKPVQRKQIAAA